jgi:hypothetical protein
LTQQGFDGEIKPMHRPGLARGPFERQHATQAGPQGHQHVIAKALHTAVQGIFPAGKLHIGRVFVNRDFLEAVDSKFN